VKQSINLNLSQQLTLTPQLQQAIKLLQLSTIELQQEIQQALENPLLELDLPEEDSLSEERNESSPSDEAQDASHLSHQILDEMTWQSPLNLPLSSLQSDEDHTSVIEQIYTQEVSLKEHLIWQLTMSPFTEQDYEIALAIIDAIEPDGFLQSSLIDIKESVKHLFQGEDEKLAQEEIEVVLKRIQRFDPIGVGSRTLSECLLIQLEQLPLETPHLAVAKKMVEHYLSHLGARRYEILLKELSLSKAQLSEVIQLIKSLNPQPGNQIPQKVPDYVIPDILVKKVKTHWQAFLNHDALTPLRINKKYAGLIKSANTNDNLFLKNQLQEARWFLKSLQSRNETLLRVAQEIVEKQQHFFEYGEEAMRPLVLHDIAEALNLHESTVSRITTQKFLHSPRGTFELKYFFSSHVASQEGGNCSSTAIRAILKKIIAAENTQKPLSDHKLAKLLQAQGISVARRTIAKYRESLGIPASNERKVLLQD